jgi:hypothetical protein
VGLDWIVIGAGAAAHGPRRVKIGVKRCFNLRYILSHGLGYSAIAAEVLVKPRLYSV